MKKMILLVVLFILSACTDYVAQIDDQIVNLQDTSGQAGETLTDSRDGQTYRTFIIGSQIWMAENLNYETSESYCYDDKKGNCTRYGRLYTYSAATRACPSGWHLPDKEEWESLIDAVGGESVAGKMLKAKRGWYDDGNGENSIGFLALPGGSMGNMAHNEEYKGIEEKGVFWISTRFSDYYYAYYVSMYYDEDKVSVGHESVYFKYSVRCVKDESITAESSSSKKDVSSSSITPKLSSSSSSKVPELAEGTFTDSREGQIDDQIVNLQDTSGQAGETLTDSRDGQTYRTFIIGSQIWMAENLNYETSESYCYDDKKENCTRYGRLYTYSAATSACPSGWHLPDKEEWESLIDAVGGESVAGKMLKAKRGWYDDGNGENSIGFLALPGGSKGNMAHNEEYKGIEEKGVFWTSTRFSDYYYAYYVSMYYDEDKASVGRESVYFKYSVRCVKDESITAESSSSKKDVSSSSITPKLSSSSSSKVPELAEGTFTDSRDGQTYKIVKIGTQTWMAENLNFKTDSSFCYSNDEANCVTYGRLYTWSVAMSACPNGWRLPTKAEFETLFTAVGGQSTASKVLKSTSGWNSSGNGSDAFAFSALPAGRRDYNGNYNYEGNDAGFWSSTEFNSGSVCYMLLLYSYDDANLYYLSKDYGFSVRCLKDEGEK